MSYIIKQVSFDNGKTWQEPISMDDIETVVVKSDLRGGIMNPNNLFKEISTIERLILDNQQSK
jgi:Neuraminidase (sialidase)